MDVRRSCGVALRCVNAVRTMLWIIVLSCVIHQGIDGHIQDDLTIPVDPSIPRIRPLRRQIRNFEVGRTGHITVVYQTTHPDSLRLRWFRESPNLPHAELQDFLTTEGDPRYSLRYLAVNDVRAVTLKVHDVRDFPMRFALVLTAGSPAIEYQLYTVVERPLRHAVVEPLDEVRWVVLPATPLSFSYDGFLSVSCIAVLDSESDKKYDDELQMYRMSFEADTRRRRKGQSSAPTPAPRASDVGVIRSTGLGLMHRMRENYAEEAGFYMTIGARKELPLSYVRYEVTRRISNATLNDEGAYACALKRSQDRSHASSWVREGRPHRRPALELIPCEDGKVKSRQRRGDVHYKISMFVGRETCVRCRAFGYPPPELRIVRDGIEVESDSWRDVDKHVNVGDGGLSEITLTLRHPDTRDYGRYECHALLGVAQETLAFFLDVRRRSSGNQRP